MRKTGFDILRNCPPPPARFWKYIDSRAAGILRVVSRIARSSHKEYCSGETLIEALIAISILTIVMAPAAGMYVNSISTTGTNRNNLAAEFLAEEGVEMVRNMRDTNLLRFSPKARECWNTKMEYGLDGLTEDPLEECDDAENKIGGAAGSASTTPLRFRLIFDPDTLDWKLVSPSSDAHLSDPSASPPVADENGIEEYRLREDVVVPGVSEECTAPGTPEHCSFHTGLYFTPEILPSPGDPVRGRESIFYRQITIEYLDFNGDFTPEPAMRVTSLVQYRAGSRLRSMKRTERLTNNPFL